MMSTAPMEGVVRLEASDRERVAQAMKELLVHGSILGLEPGKQDLYAWCHAHKDILRELAEISGLQVEFDHDNRSVQAIPQEPSLRVRLPMDATLVLLALWYEYDRQLRDENPARIKLTVEELHQLLKEKLLPELKSQPTPSRLKEILRLARRFNLVKVTIQEPFAASEIEILPTLRKVIPFTGIEEWVHLAEMYRTAGSAAEDDVQSDEPLETEA